MKKIISLVVVMSFVNLSFSAKAGKNISVDDINYYSENCYQQTVLLEQKVSPEDLSTFSCIQVLQSNWLSNEREAITRLNRGLIYLYQGQLENALIDFKKAVSAKPTLYQGHLALGKLYFSQKQFTQSIIHFDLALTINNGDPKVIRKRALALLLHNKNQTLLLSKNERNGEYN